LRRFRRRHTTAYKVASSINLAERLKSSLLFRAGSGDNNVHLYCLLALSDRASAAGPR